jgi:uncharacterized membrane-anchored protein
MRVRRVTSEGWSDHPESAEGVLGMIMPAGKTPLDETWGATITFDEGGCVSDEETARMDYGALLGNMQKVTRATSAERVKAGFTAIKLTGWASPPYCDQAAHKLRWAKKLEFGGDGTRHTLNYDVRALGRHGVLRLNFVAGMAQLGLLAGALAFLK